MIQILSFLLALHAVPGGADRFLGNKWGLGKVFGLLAGGLKRLTTAGLAPDPFQHISGVVAMSTEQDLALPLVLVKLLDDLARWRSAWQPG